MRFILSLILFGFLQIPHVHADEANSKENRLPIDTAKTVRLTYGYPPWNKDPKEIDSAVIILREGKTGKIIQINLEETAPDSSIFSGTYSLSWQNLNALAPEFYVPPQDLVVSDKGLSEINNMIKSGDLKRKPFILRKYKAGLQTVEIYDSRDQARLAMRAFRAEQELTDLKNKPIVDRSAVDAGVLAEQIAERTRAAAALMERVRIEQIEANKAAERVKRFELLSAKEQNNRRAQAKKLGEDGFKLYQANEGLQAQEKYEKAIDLDPENKLLYYQYGVVLYRNDYFIRSLVMLDLSNEDKKVEGINPVERSYYTALNYYRLKIYREATPVFQEIAAAKDPTMSPSAQFYIGVSQFDQSEYDKSQESFQKVLDQAGDPKMDQRAEQYIEQILRIKQFEAERARKWAVSATVGLMEDSNIPFASDTSLQTSPTNVAGERVLTIGEVKYRPIYEADKEFAAQVDIFNMYSMDNSFQYNQTLRNADPLLFDLALPYTIKGTFGGKGFKLDLVPGYEVLAMSVDNNTQKNIQNSYLAKALGTVIMSDVWFANYNLELRDDISHLDESTGDNDQSAINVRISNSNLFFTNKEKSKILTVDDAYTHNSANGTNFVYDRLDLGLGYIGPLLWDLTYNTKLSYFALNYPGNSNGRTDTSYTAAGGLSKKLSALLAASLSANYNINNSNVDTYQFKRWTVLLSLSMNTAF